MPGAPRRRSVARSRGRGRRLEGQLLGGRRLEVLGRVPGNGGQDLVDDVCARRAVDQGQDDLVADDGAPQRQEQPGPGMAVDVDVRAAVGPARARVVGGLVDRGVDAIALDDREVDRQSRDLDPPGLTIPARTGWGAGSGRARQHGSPLRPAWKAASVAPRAARRGKDVSTGAGDGGTVDPDAAPAQDDRQSGRDDHASPINRRRSSAPAGPPTPRSSTSSRGGGEAGRFGHAAEANRESRRMSGARLNDAAERADSPERSAMEGARSATRQGEPPKDDRNAREDDERHRDGRTGQAVGGRRCPGAGSVEVFGSAFEVIPRTGRSHCPSWGSGRERLPCR